MVSPNLAVPCHARPSLRMERDLTNRVIDDAVCPSVLAPRARTPQHRTDRIWGTISRAVSRTHRRDRMPRYTFRFETEPPPHITVTVPAANAEEARAKAEIVAGVSHLLHTKRPSHLRAFLNKLGNVEG